MPNEFAATPGFEKLLNHVGENLPDWQYQSTSIPKLFSCTYLSSGWMVRQYPGEQVTWETAELQPFNEEGDVLIVFAMAMGMGPDGYMGSGSFQLFIEDDLAAEFAAVKYSTLWEHDRSRFYFEVKKKATRPETHVVGLGYLLLPAKSCWSLPIGKSVRLSVYNQKDPDIPAVRGPTSERWFRIDKTNPDFLRSVFLDYGVKTVVSPRERDTWNDRTLLFGDLHCHSGRLESWYQEGERAFLKRGNCGILDPERHYHFARYVSRLDFYCQCDHNRNPKLFTEADWQHRLNLLERWTRPDFAPIAGCELVTPASGHWNFYSRDAAPDMPPSEELGIKEIVSDIRNRYDIGKVMLVPHQTPTYCRSCVDWSKLDPELSPLVELFSGWGSSEYFGNPLQCLEGDVNPNSFTSVALERGLHLGFIGSSDEHCGCPGDAITFYNPIGTGLACAWSPSPDRESIFDSLRDRFCYATTGARIALRFSLNDHAMGRILGLLPERCVIQVEVSAPELIHELVIIRNGQVVAVKHPYRSHTAQWEWTDDSPMEKSFYYVRVELLDGETAWASPIWVGA